MQLEANYLALMRSALGSLGLSFVAWRLAGLANASEVAFMPGDLWFRLLCLGCGGLFEIARSLELSDP